MNNKKGKYKITQSDMVLVSIYRISRGTKEKIPFEEIALQAWKDFPESFSLRNHPEFPDGSAISKRVADNLRPNGFVLSLGDSHFRLTDKGALKAQKLDKMLRGINQQVREGFRSLSRDQEKFLQQAVNSTAFNLWVEGKPDEIIDHDVKLLFRFSTATKISDRKIKLAFAMESIKKAKNIGIPNISKLSELAIFIIEKFQYMFQEGVN
jgi:hypothetical protein